MLAHRPPSSYYFVLARFQQTISDLTRLATPTANPCDSPTLLPMDSSISDRYQWTTRRPCSPPL
ncbi:hypothetical protein BDZ97DRAFT_1838226, partial [Flammula alnicola]